LPIPSINEQKQIIKEIETRLSVCDKVEQSIWRSIGKSRSPVAKHFEEGF